MAAEQRVVAAHFARLAAARQEFARACAELAERPEYLAPLVAQGALPELASLLRVVGVPPAQMQLAALAIGRLVAADAGAAASLVDGVDAFSAVLALAEADAHGKKACLFVLRCVAGHTPLHAAAVVDAGGASVIADGLASTDPSVREAAALCVEAVVRHDAECARQLLDSVPHACLLPLLRDALRQVGTPSLVVTALRALKAVAGHDAALAAQVTAAAVTPLILGHAATSGDARVRIEALQTLGALVQHHSGGADSGEGRDAVEAVAAAPAEAPWVVASSTPAPSRDVLQSTSGTVRIHATTTMTAARTTSPTRRTSPPAATAKSPLHSTQAKLTAATAVALPPHLRSRQPAAFPVLLAALSTADAAERGAAASALRDLLRHASPPIAALASAAGAAICLSDYASDAGRCKPGSERLAAVMALGFLAAAAPEAAGDVVRAGGLAVQAAVLTAPAAEEPAHCRSAAVWATAQVGRHGGTAAAAVADAGLLWHVLRAAFLKGQDSGSGGRGGGGSEAPPWVPRRSSSQPLQTVDADEDGGAVADLQEKATRCLLVVTPHVSSVPALQALLVDAAPAEVVSVAMERLAVALTAPPQTPPPESSADVESSLQPQEQPSWSTQAPREVVEARKSFVATGGLKAVQALAAAEPRLHPAAAALNACFPPELVAYYRPEFVQSVLAEQLEVGGGEEGMVPQAEDVPAT